MFLLWFLITKRTRQRMSLAEQGAAGTVLISVALKVFVKMLTY